MKYLRRGLLTLFVVTLIASGAVFAQDDVQHTVGILTSQQLAVQPAVDGFIEGMAELGYIDGETVTYIYFDPLAQTMDEEATEVLRGALNAVEMDLLLVATDREAQLVSELTGSDVPIVVCFSADLVGIGLAESLTEPGGNVTGIQNANYHARGVQILLEMDPTIAKVFFLYNPERRESLAIMESLDEMTQVLEVELVAAGVNNAQEAMATILTLPGDIDAIYLPPDPSIVQPQVFFALVQLSARLNAGLMLPVAVPVPGVLMGYGPDTFANGQQAASMADRIFRGADPATLPLENGEYSLMVNLETAQTLGLDVPRSILRQAELIIRPGDLDDFEIPEDMLDDEAEVGPESDD